MTPSERELAAMRSALDEARSQRDLYCGLALAGWMLTVMLLFMVPA